MDKPFTHSRSSSLRENTRSALAASCRYVFDYIFADVGNRRLYVPRFGQLMVFNLGTLEPAGTIAHLAAGGAMVDPKSHHGFSTTKPVTMWDVNTLAVIKTIDVDGRPDGIMFDPYNERVWVLSHTSPHATVIDAKQGSIVGTLDLGGAPEQAVSDGKGTIYVNITDKASIAVVDAKNRILFAYYRQPTPTVVILNAENGDIITTLPTGAGVDTVAFNPATMEAVSADGAGSMTFIKETSPTSFAIEQTLQTLIGAKTLTLDAKTNHILTMTAEYATPAPSAPAGPSGPARGAMLPGSFSILLVGK